MGTVVEPYNGQQVQINLPGMRVLLKSDPQQQVMANRKTAGGIALQPGVAGTKRWWQWLRPITGPPTLTVQLHGKTYAKSGGLATTGSLAGHISTGGPGQIADAIPYEVIVTVPRGVAVKVIAGTVENPEGITLL